MADVCELIELLGQVQQCISREIEDALKEHNLSVAKYNILKALVEGDGRLPFSTLVERLGCVRSNVTGLIDRLQEDHLVRRVDHPEDRRMLFAELTDEGRALMTVAIPRYDTVISHILDRLSPQQRDTLADLLRLLAQ